MIYNPFSYFYVPVDSNLDERQHMIVGNSRKEYNHMKRTPILSRSTFVAKLSTPASQKAKGRTASKRVYSFCQQMSLRQL